MLEAVNSTLMNASFVKPIADQSSASESLAANPQREQRAAPSAPYLSPYVFLDSSNEQVVLQIRNGETGDAISQFPSTTYQRPEETAQQQQEVRPEPSRVALQAQAEIETTQSLPEPAQQQGASQSPTPIQAQQLAAFQNAAASGSQPESGSVALFA